MQGVKPQVALTKSQHASKKEAQAALKEKVLTKVPAGTKIKGKNGWGQFTFTKNKSGTWRARGFGDLGDEDVSENIVTAKKSSLQITYPEQ